jgi:phage FluMu protein Com
MNGMQQLRCVRCDALLGTSERSQMTIQRGALELVIRGVFDASVSCYRCRRLNLKGGGGAEPPAPSGR